ncbi:hypothetical protein GCK32_013474, partial [Trichostrongylus colubriformis]
CRIWWSTRWLIYLCSCHYRSSNQKRSLQSGHQTRNWLF